MAIVIESSQTGTSSSSDTITITKPVGLVVGDLMVAALYTHFDSVSRTFTTPTGWTAYGTESDAPDSSGGDGHRYAFFYKLAASGDVSASNFDFVLSASSNQNRGVLLRISDIRSDVTVGGNDNQTRTGVDNPVYTVALSPAQNNVLYLAMFISGSGAYTATNVTINGTNPTWTSYLAGSTAVDGTFRHQVFAAVDAAPAASITTLTPTETGSTSNTDSVGAIALFLGKNNGNASLTLTEVSNVAFAPAGSAGAQTALTLTETENVAFAPTGGGTSPTNWINDTKPSTTWTNEEI